MKKTIWMLLGFAAIFAIGSACFTPTSKEDKSSPANVPPAEQE